jgi:sensor histidine kinase
MKRRTIWLTAVLMFVSIFALIVTEVYYYHQIQDMRRRQFEENVQRALYQTAHALEIKEVQDRLDAEMGIAADSVRQAALDSIAFSKEQNGAKDGMAHGGAFGRRYPIALNAFGDNSIKASLRQRYLKQRHLVDEVIYNNLDRVTDKPLEQRIDRTELDALLKNELQHNGIDLRKVHYHFKVLTADGRTVLRCQDYNEDFGDAEFKQEVFADDSPTHMGILVVRFPDLGSYFMREMGFMAPLVIFSLLILLISIFTLIGINRQKRLSQMKTDFINNMTHELKTPIASISLVAQMLSDRSIVLPPEKVRDYHSVLLSESKRLRMLAEKVLQISMFDSIAAIHFKFDELEANTVVEEAAMAFQLKVKQDDPNGTIETHIDAEDPIINADRMHFTNLVNNLLDNALKYRRPEVPVKLIVSTKNVGKQFVITFADNGIGIKKEDLKRIFDRFYRVTSSNVHNVKGVGIGLAYVAGVVKAHHGTIEVDSKYDQGTTFTVSFPIMDD